MRSGGAYQVFLWCTNEYLRPNPLQFRKKKEREFRTRKWVQKIIMSTKTKTRLRTASSMIVSTMTVLTMSGVMYLAPVATNVANAAVVTSASIKDGDTVRVTGTNDVYIVKDVGAKMFKRLVLNPSIFNSYGQLSWAKVKEVSQATMDSYTNTNLVQHVNAAGVVVDLKVWSVTSAANSDTGAKKWMNVTAAQFSAAGLDWDSIYKINDLEAADTFYPTGADVTSSDNLSAWATNVNGTGSSVAAPASGLAVALAGTDPASKVAARASQDVVFSTFNFTAGTSGAVKVNSVKITRGDIGDGGIAADADFTNVKLYHGSVSQANQLGGTLVLNTTTHNVTFTNLNWTVNAGTSDKLVVTGSLIDAARAGNVMMLGLRDSSSIVLDDSTQTISGTFPIFGTKVSPATQAVGTATIQMLTTPGAANLISGSTAQPLATLRFAPTTEDFKLLSVKFTNGGSGLPTDVSNLQLMYGSVVISTVAAMNSNNTITMTITANNNENLTKAGTTRDFILYGDLASTVNTSRTIRMDVTQAADVSAQGVTSGGLVTVTAAASNDCQGNQTFPNQGCLQTITQGSLSVAISPAYNPSASNVVVGSSKRIVTAVRFSASNNEAVNVTQVKITRAGDSLVDTDVAAVYLAKVATDGTAGDVLATGSLSSGTVQFGSNTINAFDSSYLFQVPKGGNYDVYILVDIPTSAAAHVGTLSIAAATDVKADGVSSMNDLPSGSITGTATGNALTITTSGNVTVSKSSTTAAATYVKGAKDKEFARFTFTADSGENATLSALKLTFTTNGAGTALATLASPTNVRVYKESVTSANLLGTVSSPSTGVANFSFSDTLVASTSRTYIIVADVPTTSTATAMYAEIKLASTDTTITGVSSGATISPGATEYAGNKMTIAVGQLGVIMNSLPVYTNITAKTNGAEVARIVLTSGINGETVRVSSIKVTLAGAVLHAQNLSIDSAALSNITLYDTAGGDIAGTGIKTKVVGTLTSNAATFSGLQIDVLSGTQRIIGVKVNVGSPADTAPVNIVMGVNNYYTDIAASGMDSLSTIYANQLMKAGVPATLFLASAIDDVDLSNNLYDGATQLSALSLPALNIAAVASGDVIEIESEDIITTNAAASTVVRNGFGGTTAIAHATTGVPIILKVGGASQSSAAHNWSTNSNTVLTSAASLASIVRVGGLVAQEDASVAAASDDIKLVTAITASGLTLTEVDAYSNGTNTAGNPAFTEDTGNDQYLVALTNYGQAQVVQAVGALTLAVSSGTPLAKQIVAGTSDVEFSRVNLSATYEKIDITVLKFTRTGDAGTSDHLGAGSDTDFASVYLKNLTDPTWGPNGNGKSNTVQLSGGVATFNFAAANAIKVDPSNASGTDVAIMGNLNTTTAGVGSGDAPKFYISTLGDVTQVTANGDSTGTALAALTAGTPTPATATNFNAMTLFKGVLSMALDSSSPSGNRTGSGSDQFFAFDMASASTGAVSTFRAGLSEDTDTNATWVNEGTLASLSTDTTKYVVGSGGINFTKVDFTGDGTEGPSKDGGAASFATSYTRVNFWMRSTAAIAASDLTFTMATNAALTTGTVTVASTACAINTWCNVDAAITPGVTRYFGVVVTHASNQDNKTIQIDGITFYNDKIAVNLASNAKLYDTAGNTPVAVTLQGTNIVTPITGHLAGTGTAGLSTSQGTVTFIPLTQFTVPTSGGTYQLVANTVSAATNLITAAGTLQASIPLGSSDNGGTTTAGNVFWWDTGFALSNSSIRWVYNTVTSITGSTISYQ